MELLWLALNFLWVGAVSTSLILLVGHSFSGVTWLVSFLAKSSAVKNLRYLLGVGLCIIVVFLVGKNVWNAYRQK